MSTKRPRYTEKQVVEYKRLACHRWMPLPTDPENKKNQGRFLMLSPDNNLYEVNSEGEVNLFLAEDLTTWEHEQYQTWSTLLGS